MVAAGVRIFPADALFLLSAASLFCCRDVEMLLSAASLAISSRQLVKHAIISFDETTPRLPAAVIDERADFDYCWRRYGFISPFRTGRHAANASISRRRFDASTAAAHSISGAALRVMPKATIRPCRRESFSRRRLPLLRGCCCRFKRTPTRASSAEISHAELFARAIRSA